MPGGNTQTCKYYLKEFIEPSMDFPSHQTLKGEMSQDIYPQRRHFEKPLAIQTLTNLTQMLCRKIINVST